MIVPWQGPAKNSGETQPSRTLPAVIEPGPPPQDPLGRARWQPAFHWPARESNCFAPGFVVAKITLLMPACHGESDKMQTAPESRDWGARSITGPGSLNRICAQSVVMQAK
jgi:hypothetical protein